MSGMIREEAGFLLVSILWGAGLAVLYDGLRIVRIAVRHASWAVAAEDFLYWVFAGFACFYLLFSMNDGVIRWFSLAGLLSGMWLYHISLSRFLVKILGTVLKFLLKWTVFPVKVAGRLLKKPVKWLTIKLNQYLEKRKQNLLEKKKDRGESNDRKQKKKTLQKAKQDRHTGDSHGDGHDERHDAL